VQPLLGFPGDRDRDRRLVFLAALKRGPEPRWATLMPGGLDEQPPRVPRAGFGDRTLPAGLSGAVLGRDQPEVAHQLGGSLESGEVAHLGGEAYGVERVDPALAAQPRDGVRERREGHQFADRRFERVASDEGRVDRADVVGQRCLRAALVKVDPRQSRG
jgi:hypothetical protein